MEGLDLANIAQQSLVTAPAAEPAVDYSAVLSAIGEKYPWAAKLGFEVLPGEGPGHFEFYPPDESHNPRPGKPTIEIRNKELSGEWLERGMLGEMLHYLPQVDETFRGLKDELVQSMPKSEWNFAFEKWQRERAKGDRRPFDQWFDMTHSDALIRGWLTPDQADEWRKQNVYDDNMKRVLQKIQQHTGITPPPIQE
jgi:hypothetical protein